MSRVKTMNVSKLIRNGQAYHVNAETLRRVLEQRDYLAGALQRIADDADALSDTEIGSIATDALLHAAEFDHTPEVQS